MSYVFVNIFPPMFYSSLEVFVVLLVIKILMFLLFQVTGLVRGHKTRKDKYYVNRGFSFLEIPECSHMYYWCSGKRLDFIYLLALSGCYLVISSALRQ